mgnify:CR=1 FL=1
MSRWLPGGQALGTHEVHVWCRDTAACEGQILAVAQSTLSSEERARADRFRFHDDRRDYIAAHDLLRRSLSKYAPTPPGEWAFAVEPGGRPSLRLAPERVAADADLTFSLSHAHGFVACAIARGVSVGVDVERVDRTLDFAELGRTVWSPSEVASLLASDEAARASSAIERWTLKEAYAKATGLGLSTPLSLVAFEATDDGAIVFGGPERDDAELWQFALYAPSAAPFEVLVGPAAHTLPRRQRPEVRMAVALRKLDTTPWQILARRDDEPDHLLPVRCESRSR